MIASERIPYMNVACEYAMGEEWGLKREGRWRDRAVGRDGEQLNDVGGGGRGLETVLG